MIYILVAINEKTRRSYKETYVEEQTKKRRYRTRRQRVSAILYVHIIMINDNV